MKTKLISKQKPTVNWASFNGTSLKATCALFMLFLALIPNNTKAQTAVVTGTGMGVCASFSFGTTSGTTTRPANYGNQNFACTGTNKDDIAYTNGPGGFRVQKSLWSFIPNTTMTLGILAGEDAFGGSNAPITLNPNDVVLPCCYGTATNSVIYMQFDINGSVQTPTYAITTWTLTAD